MPHAIKQFEGKVILITGASSGIGEVTAMELAAQGAQMVLAARRIEALKSIVERIQHAGGKAHAVQADVNVESDIANLITETLSRFGRLDAAFNNAGTLGIAQPLHEATLENFDAVMRTNVHGVFLSLKHEMAAMRQSGGGVIVNTASIVTHVTFPEIAAYTASKLAVIGLTRTAAIEGISQGIRVNAVSPGPIETPMAEIGFGSLDNLHETLANTPSGRPGRPDEVAKAVLFLLSSAASYINGQTLTVDAGFRL